MTLLGIYHYTHRMKHATIPLGEYKNIPLIGVPPSVTEYECDLCHEITPVMDLMLNGSGESVFMSEMFY